MQCAAPSCTRLSTATCTACQTTRYCSRSCQLTHRATHREFCDYAGRVIRRDGTKHFHLPGGTPAKGVKLAVMLPTQLYQEGLAKLRADEPFVIVDRHDAPETCLLYPEELRAEAIREGRIESEDFIYEKGTSRIVHPTSEAANPNATVQVRSNFGHLAMAFDNSLLTSPPYRVYSAHTIDNERPAPLRVLLIYDADQDSVHVQAAIPFGDLVPVLIPSEEDGPRLLGTLPLSTVEACQPRSPFKLGSQRFF